MKNLLKAFWVLVTFLTVSFDCSAGVSVTGSFRQSVLYPEMKMTHDLSLYYYPTDYLYTNKMWIMTNHIYENDNGVTKDQSMYIPIILKPHHVSWTFSYHGTGEGDLTVSYRTFSHYIGPNPNIGKGWKSSPQYTRYGSLKGTGGQRLQKEFFLYRDQPYTLSWPYYPNKSFPDIFPPFGGGKTIPTCEELLEC
ncbi:hypothetical protein [Aliikangiella coralliicola]|uniref:Lipoprotein n=1 Tax=Aliikangiella coralliicola TaxID=2592383 RepID=A0A545UIL4_9GAMM|nr:hypothetical protein [Aliikangiella coralliicola]TQV89306.1 hypothetical protein FLL46_00010 [Aliikangiella coralliicola]